MSILLGLALFGGSGYVIKRSITNMNEIQKQKGDNIRN